MGEKVTVMVLKVDLQCPCCYKKVKKILCKFPQIKDQVYNEKANTVTITVVCCNPEKLRDKLCCKGAKVIKSIEIKEPEKAKEQKPKVTFVEPKKAKEKPPPPDEKPAPPKPSPPAPKPSPPAPKPSPPAPKPSQPAPKPSPPEPVVGPAPVPIHGYPPVVPVRTCCGQCYDGYGGGPCYNGYGHGYGVPPPPQPCYNYGYGHDRPCHVTRCDYYFCEENPQGCSIM